MKSFRDNIFTGFIILILVSLTISQKCPEDCQCSNINTTTISDEEKLLNHVKCNTLNGLTGEEKILPIHSLDLSYANLNRISHTLEKLKDLINLNLSYNNLSEIGRLGKRIKTLILNNNKITSGKLGRIPNHVENLDLSFNEITYIPLELTKLKNLRKIELTGNVINCTCETLEVRNWFQQNHVWTDNIICTYPVEVKGQSWLQIKQSSICKKQWDDEIYTEKEKEEELQESKKQLNNDKNENENELMLGDQAIINEGSGDNNDNDELGKTFLIVSKNSKSNNNNNKLERMIMDQPPPTPDEGSTDEDELVQQDEQLNDDEDINDDNEDGSGSGFGPIVIPLTEESEDVVDDNQQQQAHDDDDDDDSEDTHQGIHDELVTVEPHPFEENLEDNGDVFGAGLGIAKFNNNVNLTTTTELIPSETTDELIVPVVRLPSGAVPTHLATTLSPSSNETPTEPQQQGEVEEDVTSEAESIPVENGAANNDSIKNAGIVDDAIKEAGTNDSNNNTYILLGIVLIALIVLIMFVAMKRAKAKRRARNQPDPESARATELQDMDKKNLGKPVHKNGNAEHVPLIEDRNKSDLARPVNGNKKVPYVPHEDGKVKEPLLKEEPDSNNYNKIPTSQSESNNNIPKRTDGQQQNQEIPKPAVRQSLEKSPADPNRKYGGYPPPKSPRTKKSSDEVEDNEYQPSSPKATSRYSPVYSPETGRVKIKLTETPKPKTPLLVTRSKSNAGEIITTPSENQALPNADNH